MLDMKSDPEIGVRSEKMIHTKESLCFARTSPGRLHLGVNALIATQIADVERKIRIVLRIFTAIIFY